MRETKRANGHQGFNKRAERKRLRERRQRLAKQIRIEYAAGGLSYSQLAKRHNLDQSTISLIVNGKRHIEVGGPVKGRDY
jgi:transcriptional regulator with XRE-family HTH domain